MNITLTQKQYDYLREARSKQSIINGVNYIAHEEMLKAFDLMEELHRDRFLIGKLKRKAEAQWEAYMKYFFKPQPEPFKAYYIDLGNSMYRALEKKLEYFTGTICEKVKHGNRIPDDMLYARCITTRVMFVQAVWIFEDFFKLYEGLCGYDFSKIFSYADMTGIAETMDKLVDKMRPRQDPHIWDDPVCINAYNAIVDTISSEGFFNNAIQESKEKNPKLSRRYVSKILNKSI